MWFPFRIHWLFQMLAMKAQGRIDVMYMMELGARQAIRVFC